MFNRLKDQAKITDQDPVFKARYIGNTETFTASGKGCTTHLVQRLWDNSEEEHFLKRVKLKLTTEGIYMKFPDQKKIPERVFPIENISFCNVDVVVNDRIFSWISRDADDKIWECHAVVCSSTEKAKSMALVLTRAFHIAYKEWKSSHTRELRNIERSKRSQSLPAMSLAKASSAKAPVTKQQSDGIHSSISDDPNNSPTKPPSPRDLPNGHASKAEVDNYSTQNDLYGIGGDKLNGDVDAHELSASEPTVNGDIADSYEMRNKTETNGDNPALNSNDSSDKINGIINDVNEDAYVGNCDTVEETVSNANENNEIEEKVSRF